jgi:hypothetical protein
MKKISLLVLIALGVSGALQANIFDSISHAAHSAVDHVHHAVDNAVDKTKHLAEQAANSAKKAAEAAANKAHEVAEQAAKEAQKAAEQVADQAKKAAEQAQKAADKAKELTQKAIDTEKNITQKAVKLAEDTTHKALAEAKKDTMKVKGGIVLAANKVKGYVNTAVVMVKSLVGKGPKAKDPNWVKIYSKALDQAFEEIKGKDGYEANAYKILASFALNKQLEMYKHINWGQFTGMIQKYKLNYTAPQMKALQEAFEQGHPIPDGVAPTPDMSGVIIKELVKTIADYLTKNPDQLTNAPEDFITKIWAGAAQSMKELGVTWDKLKPALKQFALDEAHLDTIKKALDGAHVEAQPAAATDNDQAQPAAASAPAESDESDDADDAPDYSNMSKEQLHEALENATSVKQIQAIEKAFK